MGNGGTSTVYKVLNEENEVLALKQVSLKNLSKHQVEDYANEVRLLRCLQGKPGIIGLIDSEIDIHSKTLNIAFFFFISDD